MMRAMYSAVAGLRTHLSKMDNVGNNLSNVNTPGFKKGQVTFKEIYYQTQRGASAATPGGIGGLNPQQIGLGVGTSSINVIHTRMGGTRTDSPTDVMVEGEGFFVVSPSETDAGEKFYTRAGNFALDNLGNLVTPEGYHVMGYRYDYNQVDPATGRKPKLDTSQKVGMRINQSETVEPTQTTGLELRGNLDSRYKQGEPYLTDTTIYDTLGNAYNVTLQFKRKADAANGNQVWEASIRRITDVASKQYDEEAPTGTPPTVPNLAANKVSFTGGAQTLDMEFDKNGQLVSIGGNPANTKPSVGLTFNTNNITFNKTGEGAPVPAGTERKINGNIGTPTANPGEGVISVFDPKSNTNYKSITQYANDITMKPYRQEGATSGSLTGFSIGSDGVITGTFSNGATKLLGRLILGKFDNPMGLEKVANNLFRESRNSGEVQYGMGNSAGYGAIASGTLEMSNVDMAQEFTDIITTQRGFQANSRVITTSDEMLQELVSIKR